MTFLQLVNRLKAECAISGQDATDVTGGFGIMLRLPQWINAAYQEILSQHAWNFCWAQFSGTLTAAQSDYVLDTLTGVSGVGPVLSSSVKVNGQYINWDADYRKLIDQFNGVSNTAPTKFTRLPNGSLRFFATPDSNYSIQFDYFRNAHTLVAASDVPLIPSAFHDVIVYKAMQFYAVYEGAQDVMAFANAQYALRLAQLGFDQLPKFNVRQAYDLNSFASGSASTDGGLV